jgi:hypothetical protein
VCIGAGFAFVLVAFGFQGEERKNRTAPTGYTDTPVLPGQTWKVHDIDRPRPRLVTPGARPGDPPSDAIVLFNGKDLSQWVGRRKPSRETGEPGWKIQNGYMYAPTGAGDILTKEKFSDVQLHIEWAAPAEIEGTSQWRGNSGVLLMNRYEIQVLDSWENPTYADGQAGAIYGQWPPFVNASREPGEWQSFDIVFEAPKFEENKLTKPAYVTVFHNGIVLHHRQAISGPMAHRIFRPYEPHAPEEPLALQDHDTLTRFRNIWIRRLSGYDAK